MDRYRDRRGERREQVTILNCPVVPVEFKFGDVEIIAHAPQGIIENGHRSRKGAGRHLDFPSRHVDATDLHDLRTLLPTPFLHKNARPGTDTLPRLGRETPQLNRDRFDCVLKKTVDLHSEDPFSLLRCLVGNEQAVHRSSDFTGILGPRSRDTGWRFAS